MKILLGPANRNLFLSLLLFEIFHALYLTVSQRMPLGHDGFQYFSMQYFFLNDVAINNQVPLWIPFMNHGLSATWFYTIQGSINLLANALLLAGKSIASINFLGIFHGGILVDRLLLLTGTWALGEYYFDSALTRFFVACCVMGSTISMTQFNFTLHLYYAIPLMLYFCHAFLDTAFWRYFFLACNLFMIQTFGKNADTCTIVSLTVFLYLLFYAMDQPSKFIGQIKNLRWGPSSIAGITGGLLSLVLLAAVFTAGRDPAMVNLNGGRSIDSSVPLDVFLTYAGNMDFNKWQELLLRLSPSLDFTIYMGIVAVPLVFFGLFSNRSRYKFPLLLTSLILLFFSMGTWVSVFFYYAWPMMKFYRHLSLIVPIIKLFLIFLAGFGFESIFVFGDNWQGQRKIAYGCLLAGALLVFVSLILNDMSTHAQEASHYIVQFLTVQTSQTPSTFDPVTVGQRLKDASLYAFFTGLLFLFLPMLPFKKYGEMVLLTVLLVNAGDIYGYYCTETNERTFVLNNAQYATSAFSPMPYAFRRILSAPNPRNVILLSPAAKLTLYATINAYLFQDALATPYRTIERLKPLQDMITAFGPKVLDNPAFRKIAGSTNDKIQFFKQACDADKKQTAAFLSNPLYHGDVLMVSGKSAETPPACSVKRTTADDRLNLAYQIKEFTPNSLEVSVIVPPAKPVWMMYADNWHSQWKAQNNGKTVDIFKADMAYKAVRLDPGKNTVKFMFLSPKIVILEKVVSFNALFWLLILLFLMTRIFSGYALKPTKNLRIPGTSS